MNPSRFKQRQLLMAHSTKIRQRPFTAPSNKSTLCAVSSLIRELFSFYRNTSADHDCTKNMHNKRLVLEMAEQDVNIRGIPVLWAVMTVSHMLGCSSAGEKKFYMKRLVTTSVDFSQSNWFVISRGVFRIEFSLQWELRGKGHLGPLY